MLFRTLTTAALFALGLTAAHADDDYASTSVAFGDLNLSQSADAKILADRLQVAAKSVCLKVQPEIDTPSTMQDCVDTAISVAMLQIEDRLDQKVRTNLGNVRVSMESP
jgi:UrcA family protein